MKVASKDGTEKGKPAGQLQGVHRDMRLALMFFPFRDM